MIGPLQNVETGQLAQTCGKVAERPGKHRVLLAVDNLMNLFSLLEHFLSLDVLALRSKLGLSPLSNAGAAAGAF